MKKRIYKRYKKGKRGGQHYHVKSLESIINYGSRPRVIERLERDRHKALMRKEDVHRYLDKLPEEEKRMEGVKKISILKNRKESMKERPEAEFVPGMYTYPDEIRLFPIKPDNIPENFKERADKLYTRKGFPGVLAHETEHHVTYDEDMEKVNKIPNLSKDERKEIFEIMQETKAKKAESRILKKLEEESK